MLTKTGLEEWSAPEMSGCKQYDEKIDLWSAGCVLYFMMSGMKPFDTQNVAKMYDKI